MYIYRSRFLTRGEVWFDEEPKNARVDWVYHRQRSNPLAGSRWKHFYTRVVDLRKSPAELFAELDERTARKITEAQEKDGLRWEYCDPKDDRLMDEVEGMWNEFAVAQKTPMLERAWLDRMNEAGALDLRAARDKAGMILGYHLVLLTPGRARQLIAISPYRPAPSVAWRNGVSRANCFIHWKNFLAYQSRGIPCFDFGGWYTGSTDIRLLGMNAFKGSFGGKVVREYDCEQPVTVKGRVLLAAARMLDRCRQMRARTSSRSKETIHGTQAEERNISPALR
ncbi:MAG TPA: hypothetical protein VJA21_26850 [Verrucomicrobiae bacterium]